MQLRIARGYRTAERCSPHPYHKAIRDTLKYVLPRIPSQNAELPAYFDTVENVFDAYEVRNNLKAKLIFPLLSFRAKSVICRLTDAQMDDYNELKRFLLAHFKLTPRELRLVL